MSEERVDILETLDLNAEDRFSQSRDAAIREFVGSNSDYYVTQFTKIGSKLSHHIYSPEGQGL